MLESRHAHDDAISCLAASWVPSAAAAAATAAATAAAAADMGAASAAHSSPVLVSGSWDSTVRLWPLLPTGLGATPLRTLGEHDDKVTSVTLLAGETRIAVGSDLPPSLAQPPAPLPISPPPLRSHPPLPQLPLPFLHCLIPSAELGACLQASGSSMGEVAIWDVRRPGGPALLLSPHATANPATNPAIGGGGGGGGGGATTGVGLSHGGSAGIVRVFSCATGGGVAATELRAARPVVLRASGPAQSCLRTFEGGALTAGEEGIVNVWGAQSLVTQRRLAADELAADGGSAIRSMAVWEDGARDGAEARLVTGHANGNVCWWAVPQKGIAAGA